MSKIAFIYPGQGAQKVGMGQDFYENCEASRTIYDEAGKWVGLDMKKLCFEENDQLDLTEYTQVALVTTCLAMSVALYEKNITPKATAGLSLGEYCAIVMAGGMNVKDAIEIVRQRGILMQNAVPVGEGTMAAVLGLEGSVVEETVAPIEGVSVANYNCPGQVVITGTIEGVANAEVALKEAGAKRVLGLNVSGPFHSEMLSQAGEELGKALENVDLTPLFIPYMTNVTANYVVDIAETKELLAKQVSSSVRWEQSMHNMIESGIDTFVEIGPGKTLAGFMKKINKTVKVYNVATWEDVETVAAELKK